MARPTLTQITHGAQGWDAVVDDNFSKLVDTPLPLAKSPGVDPASTWAAANYEGCICVNSANELYHSDGATWEKIST